MRPVSRLSLIMIISMLFRCITHNIADPGGEGNGSETVARGIIADSTGAPIAGIPVQLLPANYNPVLNDTICTKWHTLSNNEGEYRFDSINAGTYNIEAGNLSDCMKALVMRVELNTGINEVIIDTARLQRTGTIILDFKEMSPSVGDYMYISGTNVFTIITVADSITKKAVLTNVPAGSFSEIAYIAAIDSQKINLLTDTLTVYSGDTIVTTYATWKHCTKLYLNTTASGADIRADVYDFPVLIRLNDSIFDFLQAKNEGEDIRFAKSDGTPLAYEIESWNSIEKCAEIWVRVDTIRANNSLQYIVMYWGNSDAGNASDGEIVFDTSRGFQGVWHLEGDGNSIAFDATSNRYDGTPYNMTSKSSAVGMIGRARTFDGISSRITALNTSSSKLDFPESGTYSISLWAYADTVDEMWHGIAGKGHRQYYLQYKCFTDNYSSWEFVEYQHQKGWEYSEYFPPSTDKQWVYLTGVRNGNRQYLYVNGELVGDTIVLNSSTYERVTGGDFTIGCHLTLDSLPDNKDFNFFHGKVDEVRVMSVIPNADWVRLCYINQRADNKLIVFK